MRRLIIDLVHGLQIELAVAVASVLAMLCFIRLVASQAHAQPPVVTAWMAANAECRSGRSDDPKTLQACKKRDQISERLKRRGCLYQEDGDWWKCRH
jgi:hypothetical protein